MSSSGYWNQRWLEGQTGWDIGYASPAIVEYMRQYPDKAAAILIPGCGNAYEAKALADMGFTNITLIDIAPALVASLQEQLKAERGIRIICGDFFEHEGLYDLVLEQTFFCALDPQLRSRYAAHMTSLLKPRGKLAGVLFNCEFEKEGPPFGGTEQEYRALFSPFFDIKKMEPCYNSIAPRMGAELFIRLQQLY